jgi:tetrahydromethanopterin S-methyltransferase subunit G
VLIDKRFDGIDKRFTEIDKRFDGIDHRLDRIDSRFDNHHIECVRRDEYRKREKKVDLLELA